MAHVDPCLKRCHAEGVIKKLAFVAIVAVLLFAARDRVIALFEKSRDGSEPLEVLMDLPSGLSGEGASLTVIYEAQSPDQDGVRKEKVCWSQARLPGVPSGRSCPERAVSYERKVLLTRRSGSESYSGLVSMKLSGAGDYTPTGVSVQFAPLGTALPATATGTIGSLGEFSFVPRVPGTGRVAIPIRDATSPVTVSVADSRYGLRGSKTLSYIADAKERAGQLLDRPIDDAPLAYVGRDDTMVIDTSLVGLTMGDFSSCYSESSKELKAKGERSWPGSKDLEVRLAVKPENGTTCLEMREYGPHDRYAKVFTQGARTIIQTRRGDGKRYVREGVVIAADGHASSYSYQSGREFVFWFERLELIYPVEAKPPSAARVRELQTEYLGLLRQMTR